MHTTPTMDVVRFAREVKRIDDSVTPENVHKENEAPKVLIQTAKCTFCFRRFILIFFKVIGLATFSMQCTGPRNQGLANTFYFQHSRLGTAYNVLLTSLAIGINYFTLPTRYYLDHTRKVSLSKVIEVVQGILGTLVITVMYLTHVFSQSTFVRIFNRLLDVERDARRFESTKGCRKIVIGIVICLIFSCLSVGALILDFVAYHNNPIAWFTDTVPMFVVGWLMLQYFFILGLIESKFADVNHSIRILPRIPSLERSEHAFGQAERVFVGSSSMNDLLRLENIHARLHEILIDVADLYSLPMLFVIGFMFLTLIYNGYWAVVLILLLKDLNVLQLVCTIWWLMFLLFPLLILTTKVYKISTEMIAAATTYLVILIQFQTESL